MIEIINLCKNFGEHIVLNNLNLTINSGETRRVRLDFDLTIPAGEAEGSHAIDFEFSAGDS